ncbi:MAG: hypothetical protein JWP52_3560 [Rhizobacter sp.]|nr:hypothetical protein [Rhizobacter sp.]
MATQRGRTSVGPLAGTPGRASDVTVKIAEVLLHTPQSEVPRRIGWLSQRSDAIRLSFSDEYINDRGRPTLSQQYRGESEADTRIILTATGDERLVHASRLPPFFENMLPEGHNRERLAARRGVEVDDEFELLAAAGHDLIGGVEVVPARDLPPHVLELHTGHRGNLAAAASVAAPVDDGFSVGGYVTKFSMVHEGHRYVVRHGTLAGEVLAKLPSLRYPDMVRNEAACYRLAEAVGITTAGATERPITELDIPQENLLAFTEYLHVPRFDRKRLADGTVKRVHFEELTQALGLESRRKYRDLSSAMAALLSGLKASDAATVNDLDEVFRRWTAYALMGNTDAHAKNWGLLYDDAVHFRLAPAYDMVCVAAYFDPQDKLHLAQNRKLDESLRRWGQDEAEALAKSAGLLAFNRFRRVVRETQQHALAAWPTLLTEAPPGVAKEIGERLKRLVR